MIRDVSVENQIDQQIAMQDLSHELRDGAMTFYEFPGGEVSKGSWRCHFWVNTSQALPLVFVHAPKQCHSSKPPTVFFKTLNTNGRSQYQKS